MTTAAPVTLSLVRGLMFFGACCALLLTRQVYAKGARQLMQVCGHGYCPHIHMHKGVTLITIMPYGESKACASHPLVIRLGTHMPFLRYFRFQVGAAAPCASLTKSFAASQQHVQKFLCRCGSDMHVSLVSE